MRFHPAAWLVACLVLGFACAKDLRPTDPVDAGTMPSSHFTTNTNPNGTITSLVEASSETEWRYFDFETKLEVTPMSPDDSNEWDIAFQRFRIKTNGGSSGTGNMEAAIVVGETFNSITRAGAGPYISDRPDSDDTDTIPDYVFNVPNAASELGWYLYDEPTHTLSPADIVFVLKSVEGNYFKLQITGYYSDAGSSGYPKLTFGGIDPPSAAGTVSVDVSGNGFVHLSIMGRGIVSVATPLTSTDWDVATDEAAWQTNSGETRIGIGGARLAPPGATYESITDSPTIGFVTDKMMPFPAAPGAGDFLGNPIVTEWYNYDAVQHTAMSKGLVYLIRTARGEYGKLQILSYDNPTRVYSVRLEPVMRRVTVETSNIDASDPGVFVYFSLRLGTEIDVTNARTSDAWDLGLSRTKIKTNCGTSGMGDGGALDPSATTLAAITNAPTTGYQIDSMLPDRDAPGEYSGNPVLANWYNFATSTSTTPKDAAYLVKTADGHYAKVKITGYNNGAYTIDWSFAGAGRTEF